ncbi:MAG TPA: alpha-amylase family glycosyl hydrolase [Pyrinomonadaceae bacterium]|nr:alpha-amylase family glycosyl hydrolase [Pyrinomonadaceae bacterium]
MPKFLLRALVLSLLLVACVFGQQPSQDYSKQTARRSQEWVRDAVIYQIFERQYSQTGDFNSITTDLDRLQNLGVNVLWLMPINPIGQVKKKGTIGSPYAVRDYYAINPDYGTAADLKRLVSEAHKHGMKVIIDMVINHTAWDNALIKTHPEFYKKNAKGEIVPPVPEWADVAGLDYANRELRRYMIDMLKFWVRDFDLDGFRCDVALMVPTDFWDEARAEVDKLNPNTIWLAEAEKPDLLLKAFDLDYSWNLHSTLTEVLQGSKSASEIRKVWEAQQMQFPRGAIRMRFSDNHDERRAIARFGEKGALAAEALVFTLDGVPLVYNGMEVGDTTESGAPALFEKMPIFWQIAERRPEFPRFYKSMIALRKSSEALRRGELMWVGNSDENRALTFLRRSGNEELLVAINLSNQPFTGTVSVTGAFNEITRDIAPPLPPDDSRAAAKTKSNVALPSLTLDAYGIRIFRRK